MAKHLVRERMMNRLSWDRYLREAGDLLGAFHQFEQGLIEEDQRPLPVALLHQLQDPFARNYAAGGIVGVAQVDQLRPFASRYHLIDIDP